MAFVSEKLENPAIGISMGGPIQQRAAITYRPSRESAVWLAIHDVQGRIVRIHLVFRIDERTFFAVN